MENAEYEFEDYDDVVSALFLDDIDAINRILAKNPGVAMQADEIGWTLLMWAVKYDCEAGFMALLPHSDILAKTHFGESVIDIQVSSMFEPPSFAPLIDSLYEAALLSAEIQPAAGSNGKGGRL